LTKEAWKSDLCGSRFEGNEDKTVDREGGGQGAVEIGCQGGQGSPRTVAPGGWVDGLVTVK